MRTHMRDLRMLRRPPSSATRVFTSRIRDVTGVAVCHGYGIKAVIEGEETYRLDGQVRVVRAGEFVVLPPGQAFELGVACAHDAVGLCVDVPADRVGASVAGGRASSHPDAVFRMGEDALGLLLERAWRGDQFVAELEDALAAWLAPHRGAVQRVAARRPATRRDLYARVERARQRLHDWRDRKVTLRELSKAAQLSAAHLNRVFRQVFGVPPMRYHQRLRLDDAAERLRRGEMSATALADALGYSDLPTFTRAFRRVHGVPPSAVYAKRANPLSQAKW